VEISVRVGVVEMSGKAEPSVGITGTAGTASVTGATGGVSVVENRVDAVEVAGTARVAGVAGAMEIDAGIDDVARIAGFIGAIEATDADGKSLCSVSSTWVKGDRAVGRSVGSEAATGPLPDNPSSRKAARDSMNSA